MATAELPGNSNRERAGKPAPTNKDEKPRLEPVVRGTVTRRKRGLGKRFADAFTAGGTETSVGNYVLFDVMIPAFRDMVIDAGTSALERTFGGETHRPASRRRRGGERYDYSARSRRDDPRERPRTRMSDRGRKIHDFDDLEFDTRLEALEVLDRMNFRLDKYEMVTVADLYDLCDEHSTTTDGRWGWFDLDEASISHNRGRYLLNLPRPEPID